MYVGCSPPVWLARHQWVVVKLALPPPAWETAKTVSSRRHTQLLPMQWNCYIPRVCIAWGANASESCRVRPLNHEFQAADMLVTYVWKHQSRRLGRLALLAVSNWPLGRRNDTPASSCGWSGWVQDYAHAVELWKQRWDVHQFPSSSATYVYT